MIIYGASSKTFPGPSVRINCPNCYARDVEARTADVVETATIYFIPLRSRSTFAKCTACGIVLSAAKPASELTGLSADELQPLLKIRSDFVGAFLAMTALLLSVLPVAGTLLALLAVVITRKSPRWVRFVARLALLNSVAWLALFAYRWQQGMFD